MSEKTDYAVPVNVHMNLGKENAGKQAFLYSYDENAGVMKLVGNFVITAEGQAMFPINRGDEYIAVVADKAAAGIEEAAQGGRTYTVAAGDTFLRIAKKNGVSLQQLMKANPQIKNINKIRPGWVINVQ